MHRFDKRDLRGRTTRYFRHQLEVRFQDIDAAGIVFFARFLEYMHDGYVALLAELGSELSEVLREKRWAAPIRHAEVDYFAPLRFGDRLDVDVVAAHVADTELTLGYQLLGNGKLAAVGQTVHTFVDPASFQRIAIPEVLSRLRAWS